MIIRPIVFVFGVGKQVRLAINVAPDLPMENLVHTHDLVRPWNGQQLQGNPVQHGKNSGVHPDSQRDRQDCDHREPWILRQRSRAIAKVLRNLLEPEPAPGTASFFFDKRGIAEGAHGGVARFLRVHAGGNVFGDLLFDMKLHLVIQSLCDPLATEQGLQSQRQSPSPQHDSSLLRRLANHSSENTHNPFVFTGHGAAIFMVRLGLEMSHDLFVPQRHHRIDARSAAGRQKRSKQRDSCYQYTRSNETQRIVRLQAKKQ